MSGIASAPEGRLNISAGLASVAVAVTLVALKLWALGQTGALSIAATLVDSALDLLMSAGGLVAILYAQKPADEDHAFGHSSAEAISGGATDRSRRSAAPAITQADTSTSAACISAAISSAELCPNA